MGTKLSVNEKKVSVSIPDGNSSSSLSANNQGGVEMKYSGNTLVAGIEATGNVSPKEISGKVKLSDEIVLGTPDNNITFGEKVEAGLSSSEGLSVGAGVSVDATKTITTDSSGSLTLNAGANADIGIGSINADLHVGLEGVTGPSYRAVPINGKLQIIKTEYLGKVKYETPTKDALSASISDEEQKLIVAGTGGWHKQNSDNSHEVGAMYKTAGGSVVFGDNTLQGYAKVGGATVGGGYREEDVTYDMRTMSSSELKMIVSKTLEKLEHEKAYQEGMIRYGNSQLYNKPQVDIEAAKANIEQIDKEINELKKIDDLELKYLKDNLLGSEDVSPQLDLIISGSTNSFLTPEEDHESSLIYTNIFSNNESSANYSLPEEIKLASILKKTYDGEGFEKVKEHVVLKAQEQGMSKEDAIKYVDEEINNNIQIFNDRIKDQFTSNSIYSGDYQIARDGLTTEEYEQALIDIYHNDSTNLKVRDELWHLYKDWHPEMTDNEIEQKVTIQVGEAPSDDIYKNSSTEDLLVQAKLQGGEEGGRLMARVMGTLMHEQGIDLEQAEKIMLDSYEQIDLRDSKYGFSEWDLRNYKDSASSQLDEEINNELSNQTIDSDLALSEEIPYSTTSIQLLDTMDQSGTLIDPFPLSTNAEENIIFSDNLQLEEIDLLSDDSQKSTSEPALENTSIDLPVEPIIDHNDQLSEGTTTGNEYNPNSISDDSIDNSNSDLFVEDNSTTPFTDMDIEYSNQQNENINSDNILNGASGLSDSIESVDYTNSIIPDNLELNDSSNYSDSESNDYSYNNSSYESVTHNESDNSSSDSYDASYINSGSSENIDYTNSIDDDSVDTETSYVESDSDYSSLNYSGSVDYSSDSNSCESNNGAFYNDSSCSNENTSSSTDSGLSSNDSGSETLSDSSDAS